MIDFGYGVELHPFDSTFLEQARAWRNQRDVFKWCRQSKLITDVEQAQWFETQRKDASIRMFLMKESEGNAVGVCGLTSLDFMNRRAEFSLYIDPKKQNRGLGEMGLKSLLNHGFYDLGLNVIWGETFDGNPALKLFERLGMKVEGVRRDFYYKEGRFINASLVSILRSEWEMASWKRC